MFDLVPPTCDKHISSIYAQLGHPQIDFHSFWDVYNRLREAVDEEVLFRYSTGAFPEEHVVVIEDDPNPPELPLSHLRSCRFGEGGIPAGQIIEEGEVDRFPHIFRAHISLDDDPEVNFTDDEVDEVF